MALTNYSLTPAASATNRYTASAYYATAWAAYNDALDCIGLLLFSRKLHWSDTAAFPYRVDIQ